MYDLTNPFCGPKQYLYQLDSTATANSEILAISNHSFLIDERDSAAGNSGKKLLYKVDFNQATPPTDLATTAYSGTTASNGMSPSNGVALNGTPTGVVPLAKTLFADVGAKLVAAGAFTTDATNFRTDLPDKIEGYTWGPDLPDGRHVLLATNDNDYAQPASTPGGAITGKGFPNYIFAFAVDPSDVPEFQAPTFDTDALSTIQHIVVIYQENWSFDGLYGSFPGANGIASASTASKAQIDRLTAAALSTEAGTFQLQPHLADGQHAEPAPGADEQCEQQPGNVEHAAAAPGQRRWHRGQQPDDRGHALPDQSRGPKQRVERQYPAAVPAVHGSGSDATDR